MGVRIQELPETTGINKEDLFNLLLVLDYFKHV